MGIDKAQLKIRPQKASFAGWGLVFLAIVATAIVVGVIGGAIAARNVKRVREKGGAEFRERTEHAAPVFPELLNGTE